MIAVAAAFALVFAGAAGARSESSCARSELRLSLSTQGTAARSVIFLSMLNRGAAACVVSGPVRFEIDQAGRRARISGNPLSMQVHMMLVPERRRSVAHVWWANWCGSRRALDVAGRYNGRTIRSRFHVLPVCLSASDRSTLSPPAR